MSKRCPMDPWHGPLPSPRGPKYLTTGYFSVSILGVVIMVLGRYLIVGYLDPQGSVE